MAVALLFAWAGLAGCGGGSPTSPSSTPGGTSLVSQGLVGSWKASRAEFVSGSNGSVRVEIVSQGAVLTLVLDATGAYTRRIVDPGQTGDTQTGTWSASQDVLTLRPSGVTFQIQFDYSLTGNTLGLSGGHVQFDFNGDDLPEEAIMSATLARQ